MQFQNRDIYIFTWILHLDEYNSLFPYDISKNIKFPSVYCHCVDTVNSINMYSFIQSNYLSLLSCTMLYKLVEQIDCRRESSLLIKWQICKYPKKCSLGRSNCCWCCRKVIGIPSWKGSPINLMPLAFHILKARGARTCWDEVTITRNRHQT